MRHTRNAVLAQDGAEASRDRGVTSILLRAASKSGLISYSVPVHFDVHMHRPFGLKSGGFILGAVLARLFERQRALD